MQNMLLGFAAECSSIGVDDVAAAQYHTRTLYTQEIPSGTVCALAWGEQTSPIELQVVTISSSS